MIQATECDDLLHLTPRQETAIELLLSGKCDAATADAVGIHRTTVARWRAAHPAFQAELARRRAELFGAAAERLRGLIPKSLDVIEAALDGDHKLSAAQAVLRMAGLDKLASPLAEPGDAETIIVNRTRQRMAELDAESARRMSLNERLRAMNQSRTQADELRLAGEALADVKAELREQLAEPGAGPT